MVAADEVATVLIARQARWMDAWTLQKLLYYVQAWHLAVTDEPLYPERVEALKDGPVVRQVWRTRGEQESRRPVEHSIDDSGIDDLASDLIDLVLAQYGSMTGPELRALTHAEAPWTDARGGLGPKDRGYAEITHEAMARFYRSERRLGGRTAADLAAAGVHLSGRDHRPVDVDSLLAGIGPDNDESDVWGGANLSPRPTDTAGIQTRAQRTYASG